MANKMNHLPHINNVHAGYNHWDPVHNSIFDVTFTIPLLLQGAFGEDDVHLLQEQVTEVSGLEALQKTTGAGEQKFHGVTVSFLNPTVDSTAADLTMVLNLNLSKEGENFVLNVFRRWAKLSYDLGTGIRGLKENYCLEDLVVNQANRNGQIWRTIAFKHVMLTGISGLDDLDYTANDAVELTVTFRADYWTEVNTCNGSNAYAEQYVDGNYDKDATNPDNW
jgi:hypothetical protein